MLLAIVLGCVLGALWPGATCLAPLGTIFINLMFCIVVPLVFCSLSSSIACMKSPKRAGKIMGTTLLVFIVTGLIAAVIMLFAMRLYPPVLEPWADAAAGAVDEQASVAQLLVNFFTVEDFAALLSRRAMLPLIVFSILIGFGVNLSGGADCLTAKSPAGHDELPFEGRLAHLLLRARRVFRFFSPHSSRPTVHRSPRPMAARCSSTIRSALSTRLPRFRSTPTSAAERRACASCGGISCAPRSRRSAPARPSRRSRQI